MYLKSFRGGLFNLNTQNHFFNPLKLQRASMLFIWEFPPSRRAKCHKSSCSFYVPYLCEISCVSSDSKDTEMLYCSTSISRYGQFCLDTRTSHGAPGSSRMRRSCRICNMYSSHHLRDKKANNIRLKSMETTIAY